MWMIVGDNGTEGLASEATIKRCKAASDDDDATTPPPMPPSGLRSPYKSTNKSASKATATPPGPTEAELAAGSAARLGAL